MLLPVSNDSAFSTFQLLVVSIRVRSMGINYAERPKKLRVVDEKLFVVEGIAEKEFNYATNVCQLLVPKTTTRS